MVTLDAIRELTAVEYRQMVELGIFGEDERIELIEGQIRAMSPIGKHHSYSVKRLTLLFVSLFGAQYDISVQDPILLSDKSEPQPDVAVITRFDVAELPRPVDAFLVVEVSDTTLTFDREVKILLYAAAGIAEVWIVDVNNSTIEQYHTLVEGKYTFQHVWQRGERLMTTLGVAVESERVFVA